MRRATCPSRPLVAALAMMALFAVTGYSPPLLAGQSVRSPFLFDAASRTPPASRLGGPEVVRARALQVRRDLLTAALTHAGARTRLVLFDGETVDVDLVRVQDDPYNGFAWIGRPVGRPGHVVIVVEDGVVAGSIVVGRRTYQLRTLPRGGDVLRQVDAGLLGSEAEPLVHLPSTTARAGAPADDDGSIFDLLVLYTKNAVAGAGGGKNMKALVRLGVTETNMALENSGATPRLRLVKMAKDPVVEAREPALELLRLVNPNDAHWKKAHRLRDRFGADFVMGVVELISPSTGIANIMTGLDPTFENLAFSIVKRGNVAAPAYTFGHELGHNWGLLHAWVQGGGGEGAFPYSHGHCMTLFKADTMMSSAGCGQRIPHYSNPAVEYQGVPTGVPRNDAEPADSARSINKAAEVLANFRACKKSCDEAPR